MQCSNFRQNKNQTNSPWYSILENLSDAITEVRAVLRCPWNLFPVDVHGPFLKAIGNDLEAAQVRVRAEVRDFGESSGLNHGWVRPEASVTSIGLKFFFV